MGMAAGAAAVGVGEQHPGPGIAEDRSRSGPDAGAFCRPDSPDAVSWKT